MRTSRFIALFATGAMTLLISAAMPAARASVTAPTAPYDAFTINGAAGSYLLNVGEYAFDSSNATFGAHYSGAPVIEFMMSTPGFAHWWFNTIAPPTGSTFTLEMVYPTLRVADASHAGLDVGGDGRGCNTATGWIVVHELTEDPTTHALTSFAATYSESCDGLPAVSGEMRWQSSVEYKAVVTDPTSLVFGSVPVKTDSSPLTLTITGKGSQPATLGAASLTGAGSGKFVITSDGCNGASLAYDETCAVVVTAHPTDLTTSQANLVVPDDTVGTHRVVSLSVTGELDPIGTYYPLAPARIMDTRSGIGAPRAPIGPGGVVHLQVAGQGGVPTSGASAVVLNVTVTGPTTTSYLTVYPTGITRPGASSLNFVKGWTGANSVTVSLGTNGQIDIYNSMGAVQVIVDLAGYYAGSRSLLGDYGMGGEYQLTVTERLIDTRSWGYGPVPPGYAILLPLDFGSEVNSHIRAFAVNITAVSPTKSGYLTAWNGGGGPLGSSTLNFPAGAKAVPNLAIVQVGPCIAQPSCAGMPQIGIYNGSSGYTHVLVDIFGLFDDSTLGFGLRFHPLTPTRIVDSRIGLGTPGALGPATEVGIHTPDPVADANTAALAMNVTAVNPSVGTYLTVWPTGSRPTVSNLNPAKGQTVPNAVLGELDLSHDFRVYNNAGTVHLLVDVVGTFVLGPDYNPVVAGIDPSGHPTRPIPRRLNLPFGPHASAAQLVPG